MDDDTAYMHGLPEAPEYRLAELLIEELRRDAALAPLTYPEPWDKRDQAQALNMAAAQYGGCVAVSPQPPAVNSDDPECKTGNLRARLGVAALTTRNMPGGSAGRFAAGLLYKAINTALRWDPAAAGIPYAEPKIDSISTLDLGDLPELMNLDGMALSISVVYPYKRIIAQ